MYSDDQILERFYEALASESPDKLLKIHIPRSDVFYVRQAYYADTGNWETLDRIERCMYLEGLLDANQVLDPERQRDWETEN